MNSRKNTTLNGKPQHAVDGGLPGLGVGAVQKHHPLRFEFFRQLLDPERAQEGEGERPDSFLDEELSQQLLRFRILPTISLRGTQVVAAVPGVLRKGFLGSGAQAFLIPCVDDALSLLSEKHSQTPEVSYAKALISEGRSNFS